jgi:beta-lactamase superfamily II metal-dependent hydrolase
VPSTGNSLDTPPGDQQIEVSVFGPGFGESIVVHVGMGDWLVVDSCKSIRDKACAPLVYLRLLGVDVASRVRLVVASHWHDDHIRGLAELFSEAKNARFVCSAAVRLPEFSHILDLAEETLEVLDDLGIDQISQIGVTEITRIIQELETRQSGINPIFALGMREIWRRSSSRMPVLVRSLSPSDSEFRLSQQHLASLAFRMEKLVMAVPTLEPNNTSVVLSIRVDDEIGLLLGSDLENRSIPETGWQEVLNIWNGVGVRHDIFKVSHHGSENGHHEGIWAEMLVPEPIAVLTPFNRLQVPLPTTADCNRLRRLSKRVYLTAIPGARRVRFLDRAIERTIREHTNAAIRNPSYQGHVRLRANLGSHTWDLDLFGDAIKV